MTLIARVDRRTVYRKAARELDDITTLHECRCGRAHSSYVDFVQCAVPRSQALSQTSGQFAVLSYCALQPSFTLFRDFRVAAKSYDTLNVWGCWAKDGCKGFHEIQLVVV
jgi:hypothetical protein